MDMHARPQAVPTCDPEGSALTDLSCAKSIYDSLPTYNKLIMHELVLRFVASTLQACQHE